MTIAGGYKSRKLPRQARTIPIRGNPYRGDGEDDGKYYRCWNCGFICNIDRDDLGGAESTGGDKHIESLPNHTWPHYKNGETQSHIVLRGLVICENDGSGNPKSPRHSFQSKVTGGCPLCGSRNWRGDYP